MPIIRHGQRAITSVTPAPDQGKWANPNKSARFYFEFEGTAWAITAAPTPGPGLIYRLAMKYRINSLVGSPGILIHDNGATRFFTSGGNLFWRVNNGLQLQYPVAAQVGVNYETVIEDAAGDGNIDWTVVNLDTGKSEGLFQGVTSVNPLISAPVVLGALSNTGSSPFDGRIWNVQFNKPLAGPQNFWPVNDNGPIIHDVINGLDATITGTGGTWVRDVRK